MLGATPDPDNFNGIYQLLAGVSGAFIVIYIALALALARTREKLAKLEEWIRVFEEKNGKQ